MKKIGIVGGIGPESTIEYYRMLIKLFRARLDTNQYPEILLQSIDMTEMLDYVFNNKLDELVKFLKSKVEILEQSNIDYVALASNTPHLVFDKLSKSVNVKMISIVVETCKSISRTGIKKVELLGTKSTMSKGFYQSVAKNMGIEIVIPKEENQNYIHEKYMGELVFNKINSDTKNRLVQIVNELEDKEQIEGIVLGGTELPLILEQEDFEKLRVFNTTEIHVNAIIDKMIN
ncbi:amino acid racemase [uncultured Croceitalea sp.]|uniref:aspartate/glutamate racemase family protein n=1 Tax=uncultured Croceitalea sp. TaxID=1798908 RepID=UPI00330655E5